MATPKTVAAREWLAKAEDDLAMARAAQTLAPPRFGSGVFHCQQVAEKALKGFLFLHDCPFEKTHDLRDLVRVCKQIEGSFDALLSDARLLTPFAVIYRYPGGHTPPTREEFDSALAAAERVFRFVLSKHPELDPENPI